MIILFPPLFLDSHVSVRFLQDALEPLLSDMAPLEKMLQVLK